MDVTGANHYRVNPYPAAGWAPELNRGQATGQTARAADVGQSTQVPPTSAALQAARRLTVEHLQANYRQVEALANISFSLTVGQLVGIIGPNGAGKSTLLQAMLGLIPTAQGQVLWGDQPLSQQRQRVAYLPQRSQIDWHYPATVWDVVMMGRVRQTGWLRPFSANSRRLAQAALERVGMARYRDRPIGQLSGGQQQRVFLARALTQEAELFCFDEPFVGVDQKTQAVLFEIFHELADRGNLVLVVNHDLGASINHFDHLLLLNRELIASGTPAQVLRAEYLERAYGGKVMFFGSEAV